MVGTVKDRDSPKPDFVKELVKVGMIHWGGIEGCYEVVGTVKDRDTPKPDFVKELVKVGMIHWGGIEGCYEVVGTVKDRDAPKPDFVKELVKVGMMIYWEWGGEGGVLRGGGHRQGQGHTQT